MKQILTRFYSANNLGDDLFIDVFSKQFPDCRINLLTGIKHQPRNLGANIRIHPYSYIMTGIDFIQSKVGYRSAPGRLLDHIARACMDHLIRKNDAVVMIGGSLFMQAGLPEEELHFSAGKLPDFECLSTPQNNGKSFLIGSNLGPVYKESYWTDIRNTFSQYNHVCLRDFSSYSMVKDLAHVQYAPDVIFLAPQPEPQIRSEHVVISVIDICRRTSDQSIIDAYFERLREAVNHFTARRIPVTLTSFCKSEGDEDAIHHLLDLLPDQELISTCFYAGNISELMALISNATYIIASRFHAMILGISFGKPVFPFSYNCKTKHYLEDLDFRGNYATLEQIPDLTLEDILHNYEKQIITDCTAHKTYAHNQFRALREFLDRN